MYTPAGLSFEDQIQLLKHLGFEEVIVIEGCPVVLEVRLPNRDSYYPDYDKARIQITGLSGIDSLTVREDLLLNYLDVNLLILSIDLLACFLRKAS